MNFPTKKERTAHSLHALRPPHDAKILKISPRLLLKINELHQIFERNKKKEEEERQAQNQEKKFGEEKLKNIKEQIEKEPIRNKGFRR